ncbi:MAG: acetolactate synthase small subunit [Thermodesulfobacteriota bacterium]
MDKEQRETRHLISILVENKPGVLARVAAMFSARGYNIDSLAVGETMDPTVSRITCTTSGDQGIIEQVVKQLRKLIDVIRVVHFPVWSDEFVTREMVLVKVRALDQERGEVMRIGEIFRAKVVDVSKETITLEVTGDQGKIDAILELLRPMGVMEIARTGQVGLSRGNRRLQNGTRLSPEVKETRRKSRGAARGLRRPATFEEGEIVG